MVTGNKGRLSFVFANQLHSLEPHLGDHFVFQVIGKGLLGYLANLRHLKKAVREFQPDLIHAHYSLCGYLASLTRFQPVVVSLMGSDCRNGLSVILIRIFHKLVWSHSIVKSREMQDILKLGKRVSLIPNGVDLDRFPFVDKTDAQRDLGFDTSRKHVLFLANPARPEKRFTFAKEAVNQLPAPGAVLHPVFETPHDRINLYMQAADCLLLSSFHEGSPNVVKEALACGLPVVSTDVGDVRENLDGLPGCYVCGHSANELTEALQKALYFNGLTSGRERILDKGLDAASTAQRILDVYVSVAGMKME